MIGGTKIFLKKKNVTNWTWPPRDSILLLIQFAILKHSFFVVLVFLKWRSQMWWCYIHIHIVQKRGGENFGFNFFQFALFLPDLRFLSELTDSIATASFNLSIQTVSFWSTYFKTSSRDFSYFGFFEKLNHK